MRTRNDGGSDVVVSLDAFTVTRHGLDGEHYEVARWRVNALTAWARRMMADPHTLGIAQAHRAIVLTGPDSGRLPDVQFGYGLGFERRKDAIGFLTDLEDACERWGS